MRHLVYDQRLCLAEEAYRESSEIFSTTSFRDLKPKTMIETEGVIVVAQRQLGLSWPPLT